MKLIQKTCTAKLLNYGLQKPHNFQKCRWQRPCNMHASISKLLNFYQPKKKNQIKETPLTQQILLALMSSVCMHYQLKSQKASSDTHSHTFSITVVHTTNSRWHGLSWSGSSSHGPLSRAHVAHSK